MKLRSEPRASCQAPLPFYIKADEMGGAYCMCGEKYRVL